VECLSNLYVSSHAAHEIKVTMRKKKETNHHGIPSIRNIMFTDSLSMWDLQSRSTVSRAVRNVILQKILNLAREGRGVLGPRKLNTFLTYSQLELSQRNIGCMHVIGLEWSDTANAISRRTFSKLPRISYLVYF